jgi:hypothetical protein
MKDMCDEWSGTNASSEMNAEIWDNAESAVSQHAHPEFLPKVSVPVTYGDIPYKKTLDMVVGLNEKSMFDGRASLMADILHRLVNLQLSKMRLPKGSNAERDGCDTYSDTYSSTCHMMVRQETAYYLNHLASCMDVLVRAGIQDQVLVTDCMHSSRDGAPLLTPVYICMHYYLPEALDIMLCRADDPGLINTMQPCDALGLTGAQHPFMFLMQQHVLTTDEREAMRQTMVVAREHALRFQLRSTMMLIKAGQHEAVAAVCSAYINDVCQHAQVIGEMVSYMENTLKEWETRPHEHNKMAILDAKETVALVHRILAHKAPSC